MKTDVIRIGNSKGVRLPAAILKQCGIGAKVEIEVRQNETIKCPSNKYKLTYNARKLLP